MSRICAIIQELESTESVADFVATAGAVKAKTENKITLTFNLLLSYASTFYSVPTAPAVVTKSATDSVDSNCCMIAHILLIS